MDYILSIQIQIYSGMRSHKRHLQMYISYILKLPSSLSETAIPMSQTNTFIITSTCM